MRLLHVAPIAGDLGQGLSYSIPALAAAQQQLGCDVVMLTSGASELLDSDHASPVYWKGKLGREGVPELSALIEGSDLVVLHSTYIPFHAVVAKEARRRGIPYIIVPRGGMTKGASQIKSLKKAIGNIVFYSRFVRGSLALHCLTENEASDSAYWGKRSFVVGNGVVLPESSCVVSHRDGMTFVFIGRLSVRHKGLDLLLTAWAKFIRESRGRATLEIYGPDEHGSRKQLETLVEGLGVSATVSLHSPVYLEAKKAVLRGADVFVHTSRFEGHPMAVLEALSFGVPCLLTPGTNLADEVQDAGAGIRVGQSVEAIAAGLNELMNRRDQLECMSVQARHYAEEHSWASVATQTLAAYQTLLSENK